MDVPEPIKVGPFTIQFKVMGEDHVHDDESTEDAWGYFDMENQTIWLCHTLADKPVIFAEVILHEVQHAINDVYGVQEDGHKEEKMVTQGARGWTQVHMDNPHLMDFVSMKLH